MPHKLKITPHLIGIVREALGMQLMYAIPAERELNALLKLWNAVVRWRDYDGDGDGVMVPAAEAKLMGAMVAASERLDRISGRKS